MLDFSQEESQKEHNYGPVPGGSFVVVKLEIQEPNGSFMTEHRYISQASTGLRQIHCKLTVERGEYAGVIWFQNITLPASMQVINLTGNQAMACKIGGATLKAILEATKRPMALKDIAEFNGMVFPVQVKINNRPREKDGNVYWSNEIAKVVTPNMPQYAELRQKGEIIKPDGPVSNPNWRPMDSGFGSAYQPPASSSDNFNVALDRAPSALDEVPFS